MQHCPETICSRNGNPRPVSASDHRSGGTADAGGETFLAREDSSGHGGRAMEIVLEVRDAGEGSYWACAPGQANFTQADTWNELKANVREATALHFEDSGQRPRLTQLHYVQDELIPTEGA